MEIALEQVNKSHQQVETAQKQAGIAQKQAEIAQKQAETSERSLLNEQYQKGADMLGSSTLATRMGGIFALETLAREHPDDYHVQIMGLLCTFIRHPTKSKQKKREKTGIDEADQQKTQPRCPPDVESAVQAISKCRALLVNMRQFESEFNLRPDIEVKSDFFPDLSGAYLTDANIGGDFYEYINLSHVFILKANFAGARIRHVNFSHVVTNGTNFIHAFIEDVNFSHANIANTDFSDARIGISNFTNAQINGVNFSNASLVNANFTNAKILGTNFSHAYIKNANFTDARISPHTDFSHADIQDAIGLTQDMLNRAKPSAPPRNLPEGLTWPFSEDEDGKWHLKPEFERKE